MTTQNIANLPQILAGPIVRQVHAEQICFWLVTKHKYSFRLKLAAKNDEAIWFDDTLDDSQLSQVQVGKHAFVNLIHVIPKKAISTDSRVYYDINLIDSEQQQRSITQLCEDLLYPDQSLPSFVLSHKINKVLHGSCRKPHHNSEDGLTVVDQQLKEAIKEQKTSPNMLLMSGDQIYVDDVAGPTLVAIQQTIQLLGLFHEKIDGSALTHSRELFEHKHGYYQRPSLLPDTTQSKTIYENFFAGKKKPVFTSASANNHLISFAEIMAMYILTWSPEMWAQVCITDDKIPGEYKPIFAKEQPIIEQFVTGLKQVRRALAHIPVYMIFDDHDVTDDWNLTRGWEDAVYNDPFGRRIVGNALLGYWLCQGWGNSPNNLLSLTNDCRSHFSVEGIRDHDQLVDTLLDWERWHYHLDTSPKVVVLDTRTQRWRSESSLSKPSGLMDWEALSELQQELIDQESVIMVSAAPIFGVKLIETIQKIFTFFGKALTVDAENWMAHRGTASVILNIFGNRKTPPNFVILSGDVHYSFVYDIKLRFRRNSPNITQITSSGIKNEFPDTLLKWFDHLNHVFYSKYSPLNWLTKRRNMLIQHRRPEGQKVRTLLNSSGIGLLEIDDECEQVKATQLCASGKVVQFKTHKNTD